MTASLEVGGWRAELERLLARFGRLFVRAEPREQAGRYLEGLLGPVERKNGWQLAEAISATPGPGARSGCSATCCGTRRPPATCAATTRSSAWGRGTPSWSWTRPPS